MHRRTILLLYGTKLIFAFFLSGTGKWLFNQGHIPGLPASCMQHKTGQNSNIHFNVDFKDHKSVIFKVFDYWLRSIYSANVENEES